MKKYFVLLFIVFSIVPVVKADVGISAAFGLPYASQYGLNATLGENWSVGVGHNALDLNLGFASVKLTMSELVGYWHPFKGAFFLGLGAGQQTLEVSALELLTGNTASVKVTPMVAIGKLGWMWGKANGGFWFGMDFAFISPTNGDVVVTAPGLTSADQVYRDVEESGKKYGSTAYLNITLARLGYLF